MTKKLSIIMVTILLVSSVLVGCSSKSTNKTASKGTNKSIPTKSASSNFNTTGYPIVKKPITLTMFAPLAGAIAWKDREYFKVMQKKTNIHFKFQTVDRGDAGTKKNLLLASGNLPDIFYGTDFSHQDEIKYGSEGVIIPLEGLIKKYAPNIQKMLDEQPDIKKAITTPSGHIYSLPQVDGAPEFWHLWYNGQWLKNLGITKLPTTTNGLFNLLMKFKNDDPNKDGKKDDIPLSTNGIGLIRAMFLGPFGVASQGIELNNGKVDYGAIRPGYEDYLKYMNKLWVNNLLDHESFSQTDAQRKAKGHQNLLGLFPDTRPSFTMNVPYNSTNNPIMNLVKAPNDKPVITLPNKVRGGQFVITKSNPNPAESIRWVDYSYSKKGADFLHNVSEGSYWKWEDPKTKKVRVVKSPPKGYSNAEMFRSSISPDWGIPVPIRRYPQSAYSWHWKDNKFTSWLRAQDKSKLIPYGVKSYPQVYFTTAEMNNVTRIEQDLNKYVGQMEAQFITGKKPFSQWDSYVKTVKGRMHVEQLVSIYQKAYDRYQSK